MKTILTLSLLGILAICTQASPVHSTEVKSFKPVVAGVDFSYFRIHRQASDASLNWGITNPLSVTYFTIDRSYDGFYFEFVDEVQADGSATYRFRDANAFPGTTYYRITAHLSDGSVVASTVESVRIMKKG